MPRALFRRTCRVVAWIAWLLAVGGLTYWFVYASNTVALLCACGLAGLLYILRRRARLPYGLLECLAGFLLLMQAIYSGAGRGPFSIEWSADFARLDPRVIALQSYAGLFLLVRGLDNICEGWPGGSDLVRMARRFAHWPPPPDDPPPSATDLP
jgi:hypothetical protein